MPATKIATLNLRIDPYLREALKVAAQREHRSVANLVEVLIRNHCQSMGITIPEQQVLFVQDPGAKYEVAGSNTKKRDRRTKIHKLKS